MYNTAAAYGSTPIGETKNVETIDVRGHGISCEYCSYFAYDALPSVFSVRNTLRRNIAV